MAYRGFPFGTGECKSAARKGSRGGGKFEQRSWNDWDWLNALNFSKRFWRALTVGKGRQDSSRGLRRYLTGENAKPKKLPS